MIDNDINDKTCNARQITTIYIMAKGNTSKPITDNSLTIRNVNNTDTAQRGNWLIRTQD